MGFRKQFDHEKQNAAGKAKEAIGRARSDRPLEQAGKRDQKQSQLKKAGDRLKQAFGGK